MPQQNVLTPGAHYTLLNIHNERIPVQLSFDGKYLNGSGCSIETSWLGKDGIYRDPFGTYHPLGKLTWKIVP